MQRVETRSSRIMSSSTPIPTRRTELDGILQFYRSPAGKAMLAKTPELAEKWMAISKKCMEELAPKIQELVDNLCAKWNGSRPLSVETP
jgi:hypothetical protein